MIIDPSKVRLTEADIEEYLWHNPEAVRFCHYRVERWLKRQYRVPSGIIDLLGISDSGFPVVVEVKNVSVEARAITQVCRYAFDVHNILAGKMDYQYEYPQGIFQVIVAPSIDGTIFLECEACGVSVVQFRVALNLTTSGLAMESDFRHKRREQWHELQNDTALDDENWYRTAESLSYIDSYIYWMHAEQEKEREAARVRDEEDKSVSDLIDEYLERSLMDEESEE